MLPGGVASRPRRPSQAAHSHMHQAALKLGRLTDGLRKEVTESRPLNTKAHGRRQEAVSCSQNSPFSPQAFFFLFAASPPFSFCGAHPAPPPSCPQAPTDPAQPRTVQTAALKEVRNGQQSGQGRGSEYPFIPRFIGMGGRNHRLLKLGVNSWSHREM